MAAHLARTGRDLVEWMRGRTNSLTCCKSADRCIQGCRACQRIAEGLQGGLAATEVEKWAGSARTRPRCPCSWSEKVTLQWLQSPDQRGQLHGCAFPCYQSGIWRGDDAVKQIESGLKREEIGWSTSGSVSTSLELGVVASNPSLPLYVKCKPSR